MDMKDSIICFGDSLTEGLPGSSYLDFMVDSRRFVNHGRGGDTLRGVSSRLRTYLLEKTPETLILLVGTNDILHDMLAERSTLWKRVATNSIYAKGAPCRTPLEYEEQYSDMLNMTGDCKKIIISIPCIGEAISSEINQQVDSYNMVLKGLSEDYDAVFVDFNSWQKTFLKDRTINPDFILGKNPGMTLTDTFVPRLGELDMRLSKRRGLRLSIDGVHLNQVGAKKLAQMVMGSFS